MGILRTDRVSGLGGANAITGSVFFPHDGDTGAGESGALQISNENDALTFGTGDWTIEFWFYANRVGVVQNLYDGRGTGAGTNVAILIRISDANKIQFFTTNAFRITGSTTIIKNAWHHVALTRTGSTHTLYVNGSSDGTYSNSGMDYIGPVNNFAIIGSDDNRDGRYGLNGYISNLRVAKELIYSAAFSVPTTALVPTPNTTLLCCQSPGNVEASFGGLILTSFASNTNSKGPEASRFTPNSPVGFSTTTDVGTQFGSTFDGVTTFDSQSFMVPPGGNTRERNRGRMILFGGGSPGRTDNIDSLEIQSMGNAVDFGSLSAAVFGGGATASSTRGVFWMGEATYTTLEFVTISNSSNTTTFGTGTSNNGGYGFGNQTRGIWALGTNNALEFVTIATTGNTTDFGDQTLVSGGAITEPVAFASPTRGVIAGGYGNNPYPQSNVIEFVTIATTGNATDFGDLTQGRSSSNGLSNSTRGIIAGGYTFPGTTTYYNIIEFVTIATTGNATDFGDAVELKRASYNGSSPTRGVFAAGTPATSTTNSIEFITIATTGNATDFGDTRNPQRSGSGCSDSHGGLS